MSYIVGSGQMISPMLRIRVERSEKLRFGVVTVQDVIVFTLSEKDLTEASAIIRW